MNAKIALFVAVACVVISCTLAINCNQGIDGKGRPPLRKMDFPPIYECCYKYTDVHAAKFAVFGAVPPSLTKQACYRAGTCFYTPELNKNVCVCKNSDDQNCQPGPLKLSEAAVSQSPK